VQVCRYNTALRAVFAEFPKLDVTFIDLYQLLEVRLKQAQQPRSWWEARVIRETAQAPGNRWANEDDVRENTTPKVLAPRARS
jgi:hypothetical protein